MKRSSNYDVIVIGGGLAGLTTAALLSQAELQVLLLEKNTRLGGYAVSYTTGGHRFDIATQALGGCEQGGLIDDILRELGLRESIGFLSCEPARSYIFGSGNRPFHQSGSWELHLQALESLFPELGSIFRRCSEVLKTIYQEMQSLAEQDSERIIFGFSRNFPMLSRYNLYTVERFLTEQGMPRPAQTYFAARSGYCLLPLHRLSLIGFACTEMTFQHGAWMIQGGVQQLPQQLAQACRTHGGQIKTRQRVRAIRAGTGPGLEVSTDTARYTAGRVVSAIDATTTLRKLLVDPWRRHEQTLKRIQRFEVSGSYHVGYYSISADLAGNLRANMEIRENTRSNPEQDPLGSVLYVLVPSLIDSDAAPHGRHCLCLSLPLPRGIGVDQTRASRSRLADIAEERFCRYFPELKGRMRRIFDLGPKQLASMTGNSFGAAYGWAQTVKQSGLYRLSIDADVPGLYLAGHWTMPGGGIAGVMTSGRLCARRVLLDMTTAKEAP